MDEPRSSVRPLSPELQRLAEAELNESPQNITQEISDLKYWIKHQPHLKARTNNDQFLLTFLRGCKHDLQKAKEKIDAYYTTRSAIPEIFTDRDVKIDKVTEVLRCGIGLPLPNTKTKDSPRILLIRPGAYDANRHGFLETIRIGIMIQDVQFLEDDNMAVAGDLGIIDMANITAAHLFQVTPATLKRVMLLKQEGSPLRQKGFHFINTPPGFETLTNMGRKLLTEKNRERVRKCILQDEKEILNLVIFQILTHSTMESLYDHVPQELLPAEYGGKAGTISEICDYWEEKLLEYRTYLLEDCDLGTDEKKRIVASELAQSIYGIAGVFKQLEFD